MSDGELGDRSLLDLFREEAQAQTRTLAAGLLALEASPTDAMTLESCMRATHSLKGAARIVGLPRAVEVASAMEDCFVAAQQGHLRIDAARIDTLLGGIDLLLVAGDESGPPLAPETTAAFAARLAGETGVREDIETDGAMGASMRAGEPEAALAPEAPLDTSAAPPHAEAGATRTEADSHRMMRVRAATLDRLVGNAGEALVGARRVRPFADSLLRLRHAHGDVLGQLGQFEEQHAEKLDPGARSTLGGIRASLGALTRQLAQRYDDLDRLERQGTRIAQRVYDDALQCRMRPFADVAHAYPRIVRDLARSLGKRVNFEIEGRATQVDRDILDLLDAPLGHLLRNALDHGIETPAVRRASGKPEEARLTLEARHSGGKLLISVADDGPGVDLAALRESVVARGLASAEAARTMSDAELFEFLLLPGFTLRDTVTDVSGRGVGLDAVQDFAKAVRGTIRIESMPGSGTRFVLQLPLALSVVRCLIVDVGGEAYALPLARVRRALRVSAASIAMLEGQQHITFDGRPVGLVSARQVLGASGTPRARDDASVVIVGGEAGLYALAVDGFRGEHTLAVQPLDSRLGKVANVTAAALLDDGEVVLLLDVDDIVASVGRLVRDGQLAGVAHTAAAEAPRAKRVLVVEDSLTVRELERKLLEKRGYAVTVAVDGMDGWSEVRHGHYDLVITDVDMPRMDGIELTGKIKGDARLGHVPVMIVSYKDRDDDRRRGLDAGADYYLAKGSFHDDALLDAVNDLIGEATS